MASHLNPDVAEREGLLRSSRKEGSTESADAGRDVHPVLTLQRQLGNAQIQRMLAQREAAPDDDEVQAKRDPIQRKAPEEEEEAVQAKRDPVLVQRQAAPKGDEDDQAKVQLKRDATVQRAAEEEDALQAKRSGMPEVGLEGGPVSAAVAERIDAKRGGGSPLESGTRASMEASFGQSFEDVRIHHDGEASSLNQSLGAKAFTTGNDVFFRQDASPSDHALLAHELTHVVQQRDGTVGASGGMHVGPANDAMEQAADSTASTVASGGAVAQAKRDGE
jgi:hypothetical protein